MSAPDLDSKVNSTEDGGWSVKSHEGPAEMPDPAVVKLKGVSKVEGVDFTLMGNVITWSKAISIYARVEVFDAGEVLQWSWSAVSGSS